MHFPEYKSSKNHHYEPNFRNYEEINIYRELSSKISFILEAHSTLLNHLSAEHIDPFFKFEFISEFSYLHVSRAYRHGTSSQWWHFVT